MWFREKAGSEPYSTAEVPEIIRALGHRRVPVRRAAARALVARSDAPGAARALLAASRDADSVVRELATGALHRLREQHGVLRLIA